MRYKANLVFTFEKHLHRTTLYNAICFRICVPKPCATFLHMRQQRGGAERPPLLLIILEGTVHYVSSSVYSGGDQRYKGRSCVQRVFSICLLTRRCSMFTEGKLCGSNRSMHSHPHTVIKAFSDLELIRVTAYPGLALYRQNKINKTTQIPVYSPGLYSIVYVSRISSRFFFPNVARITTFIQH